MKAFYALILFFLPLLGFAQPSTDKLTYQTEITTTDLSPSQIISKVNKWAIDHYKNYSSAIQNRDSSSLAINGTTSVFLDYQGSHNRQIEQENYNYQLRITASGNKCLVTLRNYISQLPNSPMLTSQKARLKYIDNLATSKKRKKVLIKFANDEYDQLDKHAAQIFTDIENILAVK